MQLLDNVNSTLLNDLERVVQKGAQTSVVAANFSIYAYRELQKRLESVERFRFVFASPTFVRDQAAKSKREFYVPRLARERSLFGTKSEIRRVNALDQKALAKECADWIRRKATFKSNVSDDQMPGFMLVDRNAYAPVGGFTTAGLGRERGDVAYSPVFKTENDENADYFARIFDELWNRSYKLQDVTDATLERLDAAYRENSPEFLYYFALRHIFQGFLDEVSQDELPNDAVGFKKSKIWNALYRFQKDAALAILAKLDRYGGCVLADSVGLGKTFTALAVVKYYENRNRSVLILCPKKLSDNWNAYKNNYADNPFSEDRFRYDVLYHTDLSRARGTSNGIDLERLNWGNYDLIVIDESHNFRNGGEVSGANATENRYLRLLNQAIRAGVKTRVLMLSATPVNNRFIDLKKQLELAYEGDPALINEKLGPGQNIDEIFRQAQKAFNVWSKRPAASRTVDALLKTLDFDFFKLLDAVTIARSRRHIEKYYDVAEVGNFPRRLPPVSLRPRLTDVPGAVGYREIYDALSALTLTVYAPSQFLHPSAAAKYVETSPRGRAGLTLGGREEGLRRLMAVNLLKRLESSVYSFRLTLTRIKNFVDSTIRTVEEFHRTRQNNAEILSFNATPIERDFDLDDQSADVFVVRKNSKIRLADMDYLSWLRDLKGDAAILERLTEQIANFEPERDAKLRTLFELIRQKIEKPLNPGNKKIVIFTAFADTADYLYDRVSVFVKKEFGLETAKITGSVDGKTTVPNLKADFNAILARFSPKSKGRGDALRDGTEIDVLIATDCVSEGQNLQDCDYLINYDIHWNPVRIVQRFGRIDRIGSSNAQIQLVNFWPDVDLDEYINLKSRVETRMRAAVLTSTGDDDPINPDEKGDLEYRDAQLKRLQEEVADFEDASGGVAITDLGLNEFRSDLLEYLKSCDDFDAIPNGIYAVAPRRGDVPPGVVFVLRKIDDDANDERNRLFPYYLVYVDEEGRAVGDYLRPKKTLDAVRFLCKGKSEPDDALCRIFNAETRDGRDMRKISDLLNRAVEAVVETKNESDFLGLFRSGGATALKSVVSGPSDFELICFLVVK